MGDGVFIDPARLATLIRVEDGCFSCMLRSLLPAPSTIGFLSVTLPAVAESEYTESLETFIGPRRCMESWFAHLESASASEYD